MAKSREPGDAVFVDGIKGELILTQEIVVADKSRGWAMLDRDGRHRAFPHDRLKDKA